MMTIAILAPGAMGSAIAARLAENGARILTILDGRSAATRSRAVATGMIESDLMGLMQADLILSIVPPAEAVALAASLLPALTAAERKPVYVDCNAVDVATVRSIADRIAPTGAAVLDAAIIGLPPQPGAKGPRIHVAGDGVDRMLALRPRPRRSCHERRRRCRIGPEDVVCGHQQGSDGARCPDGAGRGARRCR